MTGNALNAHPIAEFDDLDWLTERLKPAPLVEQSHICAPVPLPAPQYPAVTASDATLWQRIRRGPLSDALYRGDISQARNDNSNAVVILLKQLALHTLGNPERMERMLKQTKLDQSRWDEKRGQYTWLQVRIFDVIQRNAAAIEARHQAREVVR